MTRYHATSIAVLLGGCFLAPGEATLIVTGLVVSDASGAPLPDAQVVLWDFPVFAAWHEPGRRIGEASTNSAGRYRIIVTPPLNDDTSGCATLGVSATLPGYSHENVRHGVASIEGGCHEGATEARTIRMRPALGQG